MTSDNKINIPFNALGRSVEMLSEPLEIAINQVLASGWYVLGPNHNSFETELSNYLGVENTIACGNGTEAIQLALTALGVKPKDKVMTAANAGGYTTTAVNQIGADPIYADVDDYSHLITLKTIQDAVSHYGENPKVIVVTHLYGAVAQIEEIVLWARTKGIFILEDCAQSLGASRDGKKAGTFGDISTTSFYPTKNLGALGDGGAVFTNYSELASKVRSLRQYGWTSKYTSSNKGGMNSRLDELQAAILRVKLPLLDGWNEKRREIHNRFVSAGNGKVRFVNVSNESFVAHLAVINTPKRDLLERYFAERGISTDIHYPIPDHKQEISNTQDALLELPVTERLSKEVLSIPLFPELTEEEICHIELALSGAPSF